MFRRLKRLWELSGTPSDAEDEKTAATIKREHKIFTAKARKKRDQKLATVLQDSPLEVFPSEEELAEKDNDTTS